MWEQQIPEEIINAQTNFQQVFKEKEKIRKLEWIPILSNCSFQLNNYNIKGSIIYYLIIEALINNNSLDDIGLSKEEISSSISILKENNIITQNQDHYKITCIDKNSIDLQLPSFLSPHRIKNKETEELFQFRKMKIECAIVWIMKQKRILEQDELYNITKKSFPFQFTNEDFNECVNSLINKEYLKRTDGKIEYITF